MSFLNRRRPKTGEGIRPTSFGSSTLSHIFTKSKHSSGGDKKKGRVVSESASHGGPISWSAGTIETRTSTSSGTPSIEEIRRPSGLGERADSMLSTGSLGSIDEAVVVDMRKDMHRPSVSQPSLLFLTSSRVAFSSTSSVSALHHDPKYTPDRVTVTPINAGFPTELMYAVCGFLSRSDLLSVACASTSFLAETRKLLYENVDLGDLPSERSDKCMEVLASRRDLASLVRTFSSPNLPSIIENDSPLPYLSFSIALHNMSRLTSLSLPRFDTHLLHYTSFRLERATFGCDIMSETEQQQFSTWIANQGDLVSLSLPTLTTEIHITPTLQSPAGCAEALSLGNLSFPAPPIQRLVLPKLTRFDGPASLMATLVPGRPVTDVVLHVQKTLYDGLKPSALMSSLAKSVLPITRLSIVPSSHVDARTLERLLMSAGADLGSSIQTLEVDWMFDSDILYKSLVSIISRFKKLQTLHLHRKSPPLPSISVPPSPLPSSISSFSTMTPSPSVSTFLLPPQSPYPRKNGSYSTLPSPFMSETESTTSSTDFDNRKSVEHRYLKSWAKSCSTLRTTVFLSGAEWCIMKRRKRKSIMGIRDTELGPGEEPESRTVNVLSFVRWRVEK